MEFQLVSAMLVILFFILYREQRKVREKSSEALSNEVSRLQQSIDVIDGNVRSLSDKVVIVYGNSEKPLLRGSREPVTESRSDETAAKAVS